jgi:ABC-type antimicrobial peptide transport system permease subunit
LGGLGRRLRARVHGQRQVAKHNPHLVAVGIMNLLEGRTDLRAVRSLKIREFNDRDLGVRRPLGGIVAHKKGTYFNAEVKATTTDAVADLKRRLLNSGYEVLTMADILGTLRTVFIVIEGFMACIGAIGLIVSIFGIANTMAMAVLERTREIGIMKAIGARNSDIRRVFLFEAIGIGLLGGIVGLAAGAAGGRRLDLIAHRLSEIPAKIRLFHVSHWLAAGSLAFSVFVSMVAGFMPALRASRLDPVRAVRYE